MTKLDDGGRTILRNMLLGRWAAEKLGIRGADADAYSQALATASLDPDGRDVFAKLRKDFDAAGVVQTDEQILQMMTDLTLAAGNQLSSGQGGAQLGAAVMLARKLTQR